MSPSLSDIQAIVHECWGRPTPDLFAEYREDGLFSHPDLYLYSGQFRLRKDSVGRHPHPTLKAAARKAEEEEGPR